MIGAGSLEVSGTFTGTFSGHGADTLAGLLGLDPPRHHMRIGCPAGAGRRCPVCNEPTSAVVIEDVAVFSGGLTLDVSRTGCWLVGVDPTAYRCEPCGHRFDRDGTEIVA